MGADTLVIRHSSSYITFEIAKKLDAINSKTSVLNAGDGLHSHPSQGLLDIYTLIKFFSKKTLNPDVLNSKKILIIGVGGVDSADGVFNKIVSGATLVQLYTGMVYKGPTIASKINKDLDEIVKREGFKNISEAIGTKN